MTAVSERRAHSPEIETLHRRIRSLTITVIVLAVVVLGLGGWVIYDYATGSDTAVSSEVEAVLDDYIAAWNTYDSEAFLALVTDNYSFEYGGGINNAQEEAAEIAQLGTYNWSVEVTGDRIMVGDGPAYVVAQPNKVSITGSTSDGISLFTIVERDGVYLISHHSFTES